MDGAYARAGGGGAYRFDARHDALGRFAAVLPLYNEVRHAEFARFAVNVWGIDAHGISDEETAAAGLAATERWMTELGLAMSLKELGVREEMLEVIADSTLITNGGYKVMNREDILAVLKASI